jgi:hypothetical protein
MSAVAPTEPSTSVAPRKRSGRHTAGIVISAIVGLFLIFDSVTKLAMLDAVKEGTAKLGFRRGRPW